MQLNSIAHAQLFSGIIYAKSFVSWSSKTPAALARRFVSKLWQSRCVKGAFPHRIPQDCPQLAADYKKIRQL